MKKIHILFLQALIFISFLISNSGNAQMYWNQAANFPGTAGSYVAVPPSASLNITGDFTLEAWIYPVSNSFLGRGIISKGNGLSSKYALRITNGRISLSTNAVQRVVSRASNTIPLNTWTHVAGTYVSVTGKYRLYINGILDTTVTLPSTDPMPGTDSLTIGSFGSSTEFAGMMDEVRIWDRELSVYQIFGFMKTSMGLSGDFISDYLVMSMSFQNSSGSGTLFTAMDHSDNSNNGFLRNVTGVSLADRPSGNHIYNDCIYFPPTGAIFTAQDNPSISPTNKMTIEFWIYPKFDNYGILYKGSFPPLNPDYSITVASGKLNAFINNTLITSNDSVKKERWSHIAFTYFGATGRYEFYVNGKRGTTGNITPGNIRDSPDSLCVGGFPFFAEFSGYMDEFRITHDVKSAYEINSQMFTSINESNDDDATLNAVYNLDGSTLCNTDGGPRLYLRETSFNFNSFIFDIEYRLSPVVNFSNSGFNKGYYLNMPDKRIPASGSTGTTRDTIDILSSETISDLNIFAAINHGGTGNLKLTITSPIGASAEIFANTTLLDSNENLVTIFDSDADSSLISNRYINFGPRIKPQFDIDAIFGGSNSKGKWILSITDEGGSDTGFISAWGLQINNNNSLPFDLECTSLIEGFYNSTANTLIQDTVRYFLRSAIFPYSIIDSSKAKTDSLGKALVQFINIQQSTDYFLVLKHRNSVETWSSSVINFSQFTNQANYDFSDLSSKAFGNNMKQVDTSPVRFAVYSGDENQNGIVDLTDVVNVTNAANAFINGYVSSDMNGDNLSDLADVVITSNNAGAFVAKVIP
ncbi:MAG: proprotein convertase P-domain-containing protein [Ignavibacteriae bacterium]|nr:proprotein convertase P-domain-containing protein [Ignavibacteriota bacterium]